MKTKLLEIRDDGTDEVGYENLREMQQDKAVIGKMLVSFIASQKRLSDLLQILHARDAR